MNPAFTPTEKHTEHTDDEADRIINISSPRNRDPPAPTTSSPKVVSDRVVSETLSDVREPPSRLTTPGESGHPISVIHSTNPNPTPKPKLWSLAEIATSDKSERDRTQICGGAESPLIISSGTFSPSRSPTRGPSLLPRHLYYASAFYPAFTNYSAFSPAASRTSNPLCGTNGLTEPGLHRALRANNPTALMCKDITHDEEDSRR